MKLRWRAFEKSMRRRVRGELRASKALRLESKRTKGGRESAQLRPGFYRVILLVVVWMAWVQTAMVHSLDSLVTVILGYSVLSICGRAIQLRNALRTSPDLQVLRHLPLSSEDVFAIQWRKFLRKSAWSVVDFAFGYAVLAWRVGGGWTALPAGLGMGAAQWLVVISAAICLAAYTKGRQAGYALAWTFRLAFVAYLLAKFTSRPVMEWLADLAGWMPPMGWSLYALGVTPSRGFPGDLIPALLTGLILLLLPRAYKTLRRDYAVPELAEIVEPVPVQPATPPARRVSQGRVWIGLLVSLAIGSWAARRLLGLPSRGKTDAPPVALSDDKPEPAAEVDPHAALKAAIRCREFLAGYDWKNAGVFERLAFRMFTPGERLVAEFLSAGKPRWTAGTRTLLIFSALAAVVFFCVPAFVQFLLPVALMFVVFYLTNMLGNRAWPGVAIRRTGGLAQPFYSVYPVGFREITGVMLKVNLARLLLLPVLAIAAAVLATFKFGVPPGEATRIAVKGTALIIAVQPLVAAIPIISNSTGRMLKPKHFVLGIPCVLAIIGGAVVPFLVDSAVLSLVLFGLLGVMSFGGLCLYGHAFNHNWFDLQSKAKDAGMGGMG